jgi:hypothetical protein
MYLAYTIVNSQHLSDECIMQRRRFVRYRTKTRRSIQISGNLFLDLCKISNASPRPSPLFAVRDCLHTYSAPEKRLPVCFISATLGVPDSHPLNKA